MTITISGTAERDLETLRKRVSDTEAINRRIGGAVKLEIFNHLAAKESEGNKNGWPSLHFYANSAKSMSLHSTADLVRISINWQGFRQRVEGGDIKPVDAKYLTIPARSEAYGRRAREFGNLKVQFGKRKDGTVGPVALVAGEGGATKKVFHGREAAGGDRPIHSLAEGVGVFWLVKSVHQQPDPSVLPTEEEIMGTAHGAIRAYLERG